MTEEPTLRERWQNVELWPTPDGPWHPVTDDDPVLRRTWDQGADWCVVRHCHPQRRESGYPHPDHLPADECYSRRYWAESALEEFDGEPIGLGVYAARCFAFGEEMDDAYRRRLGLGTRVVIEVVSDDDEEEPRRVSISLGDALLLARHIEHTVQLVTGWAAPIQ